MINQQSTMGALAAIGLASAISNRASFSRHLHLARNLKSFTVRTMQFLPTADDSTTMSTLLLRAKALREILFGDCESVPSFLSDSNQLAYSSSTYLMNPDPRKRNGQPIQRGFCNWLLPQRIMIGQYPGMTPELNGPSSTEAHQHVQNMIRDANVTVFCCLQTEVPSQEDDMGWEHGTFECDQEEVYLEPMLRRECPRPFTRYSKVAQEITNERLQFIHTPIEDLRIPRSDESLLGLLSHLLYHCEVSALNSEGKNAIYIHCWGGRGRAGLVASCFASLLFPELSSNDILQWIQNGYDTRVGADQMIDGLRRSPQSELQRMFVFNFVSKVRLENGKKKYEVLMNG